jgi:3-deoxy-D-manno-octulosonic-acid transferase
MMRWLYSVVMGLAQPLLRRKLARRGLQEPGYLEAVPERFGHYTSRLGAGSGPTVWVHAVSLGETRAASVLVAQLRERLPGMRLLLTHGTATGRAEGARLLQVGDVQVWQPWDTPSAVSGFLAHFQPAIGILMETEVWPNLAALCQRAKVPLVLANARLSEKSLVSTQRLGWLARPAYRSLAAVWAQTQEDARRLILLGAPVQGVFGNLKFDATPDATQLGQGRAWRQALDRPVVVFASSREGEEEAFLRILRSNSRLTGINKGFGASDSVATDVQWLIVPRHPQRFAEVAALIGAHGFGVSRRSQWRDGPPPDAPVTAPSAHSASVAPVIWLGDSLGEMALYYGLADVALLGGSFEPLGGQNLIEAAACGCPVLMGPHTFNFAEAAELAQSAGAALRVPDMEQAVATAQAWVSNPAEQADRAAASTVFSDANRGAVAKTVAAVVAWIAAPSNSHTSE